MILGVDVGGTFTDAALLTGDRLVTGKSPTTPADQSEGVMNAVEQALGAAGAHASDVERFVHGMTVGTNALLEERVARTALLATEGFTDLEELGRQARPELYRLCAGHPPPLAELRVPVPERTGPDGVLRPLDEDALQSALEGLEFEAAAVCLLWGFRHPEHEKRVGELIAKAHVSLSHETAGVFREYERCATTVVDAALSPLLRGYLERLAERARSAGLPLPEVMLSSGGTADAETAARHGSWTVLSGPAGRAGGPGPGGARRGDRRAARILDRALGAGRRRRRRRPERGGGRHRRRRRPGHGRDLMRRLAGAVRARRGRRRARGRREGARPADGRRPHGGSGRRIDRLARRGRRPARWAALRRGRARPGRIRSRRRGADGHRRQPGARLPRPGLAAGWRGATRPLRRRTR